MLRIAAAMLYVAVSMLGVGAIALFLSTLTDSPLARRWARWPRWSPARCWSRWTRPARCAPYLPTRYWLAWIDLFRDPILWRDIERGPGDAGRVRGRVPRRRPGPTSPPRTSRAEHRLAAAVGRAGGQRCRAERAAAPARSRTGRWAVRRGRPAASGQTDCTATLTAPSSRADSGGVTVSSCAVHTDSHAGGVGTGLASDAQKPAARRELLAGGRAGAGHRGGAGGGDRGAVVRRAERDHAPGALARRRDRRPTAGRRPRRPSGR